MDAASTTGPRTVRSLTADGRLLRTETTALVPLFGDEDGGFLALSFDRTTLARVATPGTQAPWSYRRPGSSGQANPLFGAAQSPDGTVHVVEYRLTTPTAGPGTGYNSQAEIVGLAGRTGAVTFRAALPPGTSWTVRPAGCTTGLDTADRLQSARTSSRDG